MANDDPMTVAQVGKVLQGLREQMPELARGAARRERAAGDARDASVYLLDEPLLLAVQVAVATSRPLLLTGDPGTGKSTLAAYVAARLGWRYYEHVVTGRTEANDLLWQFDTVRKLGDASGNPGLTDSDYVEPGVLWWAFDRKGAMRRGAGRSRTARSAQAVEPAAGVNADRSAHHAVVLIDEIDKADPDVPNALLVPLGSSEFVVRETQTSVRPVVPQPAARSARRRESHAGPVLVIITSNGERELPPAFLRRCVVHQIDSPGVARLEQIARAHAALEGRIFDDDEARRVTALATQAVAIREASLPGRRQGSTAEFLDAVRASRELRITADRKDDWDRLISLTLRKGAARS